MKVKSMIIHGILATSALLFSACSGEKKESAEIKDTVTEAEAEKHEHAADITRTEAGKPEFTVDEVFQKQLGEVFTAYVGLKEAFVSSDASKVKDEAEKVKKSLAKTDMKLVTGPAHNDWMVYLGELSGSLDKISASSDIEAQRTEFSKTTYSLYKAIKAFGLGGATAYYEFCPMAFDNKGAYWLSDNSTIRNPYFGDKMLSCGSVEETLQ